MAHRRRLAAVNPADAASGGRIVAANRAGLLDHVVSATACWIPDAMPACMAFAEAGIRQKERVAAVAIAARCFRMGA